jgi:putative transposase
VSGSNQPGGPTSTDKVDDLRWAKALARNLAMERLSKLAEVSEQIAEEEAKALGVTARHVRTLLKQYRERSGLVTDMLPQRAGAKGPRLDDEVEVLMEQIIKTRYLIRKRPKVSTVHALLEQACVDQSLTAPSLSTFARRVREHDGVAATRRRGGEDAARRLKPVVGSAPSVPGPLRRVEIDHTVVDLMVVSEDSRLEIGRPSLTLAIDNYSRCIVGVLVSLEAPSTLSVGLCLAHMIGDKAPAIEAAGLDVSWPMSGKPMAIYVDNGADFHSEGFRRGCEQHGIQLDYRPPGEPQYGGTVERAIKTFMDKVHDLDGTTFSNPWKRGKYKSAVRATMTMREFERWLILNIAAYHGSIHRSLGLTPASRWAEGIAKYGSTPPVVDPANFLLGFLPVERRTIRREGIAFVRIHYYSNALRPWIETRDGRPKFVVRYDPRDLSRVWVEDPDSLDFLEVPANSLVPEKVTLWEWRAALREQKRRGANSVDKVELARITREMQEVRDNAAKSTRRTRRDAERVRGRTIERRPIELKIPSSAVHVRGVIEPFEDLEPWK